jgi:hypothetical protein
MKKILGIAVFTLALVAVLVHPLEKTDSVGLTSVKDTLQTSRLSFHGRVDSTGTITGGSNVKLLGTTGLDSATSQANTISTIGLKAGGAGVGDSVIIGVNTYTVVGVSDSLNFTVTPVLIAGDTDNTDPVYVKIKPQHTVAFSTVTAVPNGFFQVLLPADTTTPNNGLPDDAGYDFNTTVDVVAADVGVYDFVTGVATAAGATGCTAPANYHCFEVHYSGNGSIGQAISITIGNTNGTNTPVSPAAAIAHTEGTADTYPIIVNNFAAGVNPNVTAAVDHTNARLAHIEPVRVSATVDPTINFAITGVASGQSRCGVTTDVTTTVSSVPFGTMALNTFKNLSHQLTVSTNGSGGYVVTASENDQLGKDGTTTPFIPDSTGNAAGMTESTFAEWTTTTINGFGFSIQNLDAAVVPFQYTTATGACTGTFCARQFADIQGAETPQTIMSSTTIANAEDIYVCYRLGVGATQAAGDYENQITYTATGTF